MGQKDVAEKNFMDYNDVFADIVNVALFNGDSVVEEDALEPAQERSTYKFASELHEQTRDVAKFWRRNKMRIALIGLENQTAPDPDMPLRVIGYDGAAYRGQLLEGNRPHYPVVTIVLYFGEKPWNAATSLHECLEMDECLRPFVNDYKITVLDVPRLAPETIAKFRTGFRIVAKYFAVQQGGASFHPKEDVVSKHVEAFFDLMRALTGDRHFEEDPEVMEHFKKEGGVHMCEFLDGIENRGIAKGMEIGERRGMEIGERRGMEIGERRGMEIGERRGMEIGEREGRLSNLLENARSLVKNTPMNLQDVLSALNVTTQERQYVMANFG